MRQHSLLFKWVYSFFADYVQVNRRSNGCAEWEWSQTCDSLERFDFLLAEGFYEGFVIDFPVARDQREYGFAASSALDDDGFEEQGGRDYEVTSSFDRAEFLET